MHGAKLRLIGLTLFSGVGVAVGCSGDDSGGGSGNNNTSTVTTNTVTTTISTNSSTSSQSTNNTNTSSATNSGTTSTTGSGGSAGDTGCQDDPPVDPGNGGGGEGGAAGASGGALMGEGWNFVEESEIDAFNDVEACDGCNVTVGWACGVMEVTVEWAGANEASQTVNISNTLPEDMLRDMSGATIVLRAKMKSDQVDNNGYDFKVFAQDFGDGTDWDWFDTTWGSDDRPQGEAFGPADVADSMLPLSLASSDFSAGMVRKVGLQIGTKHWEDEANPPVFNYTTTVFEIDYLAW